jgi:hypothetical protein
MDMIYSKSKFTEFKTQMFQFPEPFCTCFNMQLLSKTPIPLFGDKQYGHPIALGVTQNLFRAYAIYILHKVFFSCCTFIGHTLCGVPRATEKERLAG